MDFLDVGVGIDAATEPNRITLHIPAGRRIIIPEVVVERFPDASFVRRRTQTLDAARLAGRFPFDANEQREEFFLDAVFGNADRKCMRRILAGGMFFSLAAAVTAADSVQGAQRGAANP